MDVAFAAAIVAAIADAAAAAAVAAIAVAIAVDAAVFAAVVVSKHYCCHSQLVGSVRSDFHLAILPTLMSILSSISLNQVIIIIKLVSYYHWVLDLEQATVPIPADLTTYSAKRQSCRCASLSALPCAPAPILAR